ncbi:MAG: long-chain fatty acid--CoA ligase [Desulfobacteraceae bacterium]|nr:MAG: long-chain fatty acid--CoA ligase [Desulfobacteraceae bacterium]
MSGGKSKTGGNSTRFEDVASLSAGEVLERSALLFPRKPALVYKEQRIPYEELNTRVDRFASGLASLGITKGDRVVIDLPNSPELVVSFYGLAKLGAISVWCNPIYRHKEVSFILGNSGAKGIILRSEFDGFDYLGMVRDIRKGFKLDHVITVGDGGDTSFEELSTHLRSGPPAVSIDPETDFIKIIYTSGATGIPKGSPYTHTQAIRSGFVYAMSLDASSSDIFLAALPLYHSYAFNCLLMQCPSIQATMVLMERWDPEEALKLIQGERVTIHPVAPTHYIMEMNHPRFKEYDLSSLRAGLISGYVPPPGLMEKIEREYKFWFCNFWGTSETGPGTLSFPDSPRIKRLTTAGRPHEGESIRIVHPETGEEVPRGTVGELTLKGWNVTKGYWNNPEETSKHFDDEGWFHIGDLAFMDDDGYVTIVGRLKDQINRGGLKIVPNDVEEELRKHPDVSEAVVVGTPNPVLGESICACIIPNEGVTVTLKEIREFLSQKVSKNKLPDELCIMKEFPKLSGGVKLNKYGAGGILELALKDPERVVWKKRS